MNDQRIQQVLEIEKQAQQILDSAVREAEQLPISADQEAQQMLERARASAEKEARHMVEEAQTADDTAHIMSAVDEKTRHLEKLAEANRDRAIAYVLEQVIGKD